MRVQTILATALFAAVSALPFGVHAADMEKAPAGEAQAGKMMKPHSYMEEKTGVPPKAPEAAGEKKSDKAKADKYRADKDKSRHLHPRDAK